MQKRWSAKVKQFAETPRGGAPKRTARQRNAGADDTQNEEAGCPLDLLSGTDNVLGANLLEDTADEVARDEMQFQLDDPAQYTSIWEAEDYSVYLNMLSLFENVLTFYRWLRLPFFWSSLDAAAAERSCQTALTSVQVLMDGIRMISPRLSKEGKLLLAGWNIPKFHMLVHLISQIQQFGPPVFWDVEAGESNHKFIVKNNAVTCQKRGGGVFLRQLTLRMWANQTLWLMCSWLGVDPQDTATLVQGRCPNVFVADNKPDNGPEDESEKPLLVVGHTNTRMTTNIIIPGEETSQEVPTNQEPTQGGSICHAGPPRHVFLGADTGREISRRNAELDDGGGLRRDLEHENDVREFHETDSILVHHTFHTSRTRGLVFPMFATKWFKRNHTLFTISPGQPDPVSTDVLCFTEITHRVLGTIRCHPNYQGDGPWRDWVKATFKKTGTTVARTYLCQVLCFIKSPQHMLNSPDLVLLRTTCAREAEDTAASSVLFHRWKKDFDEDGEANVQMVPIERIKASVGVVDENPEMIADRDGVSSFLNTEEERQLMREDLGNRQVCKDIVWEVLSIEKWASEFCNKATERVSQIVTPR
jgi:hypothetical protein